MPVSKAKSAANARWDAKNLTYFGMKLPNTEADAFKAACAAHGVAPYAVLQAAARDYIRANTNAGTMEGGETV